MKYGIDVASIRLDDLDKRLLLEIDSFVSKGSRVRVLDIGCGQGGLSLALAKAGAIVTALDIDNYKCFFSKEEKQDNELFSGFGSVTFIQGDISDIDIENLGQFDIVVMQRVLHYLPFTVARNILQKLRLCTNKVYLSVTGLDTAIANHYSARGLVLDNRWGSLDENGQKLFSITAPLCLYTKEEIITVLAEVGFNVTWSRVSDFGNIKVIAN